MGGNALKNTITRRYQADEYYELVEEVKSKLYALFPDASIHVLRAYDTKESFGDMDVLISNVLINGIPPNTKLEYKLLEQFGYNEIKKNGNVYSFDHKGLQIDLILTSKEDFLTSAAYYDYNDLGNLLGRISHKMGFKYGHQGLTVIVREGDYVIDEIIVSKNTSQILEFLGYDVVTYIAGFDTMEDIYEYVASGKFFNPEIFLLDNRNHKSRIRDRKRTTYSGFLEWCEENKASLKHYPWPSLDERGGRRLTKEWIDRAETFWPGTGSKIQELYAYRDKTVASHAKWSGGGVMERTGLQGKELGEFITVVKGLIADFMQPGEDFHDVVLRLSDRLIHKIEEITLKEWTLKVEALD